MRLPRLRPEKGHGFYLAHSHSVRAPGHKEGSRALVDVVSFQSGPAAILEVQHLAFCGEGPDHTGWASFLQNLVQNIDLGENN